MDIDYEIDEENGIMRVWIAGTFSPAALDQGCEEILRRAEAVRLACLSIDLTQLDGRPNLSHTVLLLERFKLPIKSLRIAVVDLAEQRNFSSFLQLFCTNRGLKLRVFEVHDDAQEWLGGGGHQALSA